MVDVTVPNKDRHHREGFFSSVITLLSGKGMEALIGLVLLPIVTRLFSPEDYGLAVTLIAVSTMLMPVATLTYERAIVLTESREAELALVSICLVSGFVFSVLIALANSLGAFNWYVGINASLVDWFWVVPVYLILRTVRVTSEQIAIKHTAYKKLASAGVLDTVTAMLLRIVCGYKYGSELSILIVAYATGMIARVCLSIRGLIDTKSLIASVSNIHLLINVAKQYRDFPKYQMLGTFLRLSANNLPVIFLATLYSPTVAGVYAMATALSRRPLEMVSMSYRSVFLQRGAVLQGDTRQLRMFFLKHTALTIGLGILPFGLAFFLSPVIFPSLLGENWQDVGEYVRILTPWLFSFFVGLPAAGIFILLKRQQMWLRITAVNAVLQLAPILAVDPLGLSAQQMLWAYSLLGASVNMVMIMVAYQILHQSGGTHA